MTREGEGWPLLTVETEANGDSKSTNERGPSLVVRLSLHAGTKGFCPSVAALVSSIIFCSSLYTISNHLSASPSKLGRQSCRVAYLLMFVLSEKL